jgi:acetyl esterase
MGINSYKGHFKMSSYAFDPDFKDVIGSLPTQLDFSTAEKVQEFRKILSEMEQPTEQRDDIEKTEFTIPGPEGAPDVAICTYRPIKTTDVTEAGAEQELLPCIFEIHGGGFMVGDIKGMDGWGQHVARSVGCLVVCVEYRLAPEAPFPAAIEDCYAALCWIADHAEDLGIDPKRIAIMGQSAGGGLAAGTALLARDNGAPELCLQVLEVPELDDRLDTVSMKAFSDTPNWNRPNAVWSWMHYLGPDHKGEVSPYAAPARATDLTNLPPTYISTMEFDPLRDEGILYAMKLMEAGVSVELHSFLGTFHGSTQVVVADGTNRNDAEILGFMERRCAV